MKKAPRLRRYVATWVITMLVVMIIAYSGLVLYSLQSVLLDAAFYGLKLEARDFIEIYQQDPEADLPHDKYLSTYTSYDQLPEWFSSKHSRKEIFHKRMIYGDISHPDLFDGEDTFYLGLLHSLPDGRNFYLLQVYRDQDEQPGDFPNLEQIQLLTLALGIFFILIMGGVFIGFFRSISAPISMLTKWAKQLNKDTTTLAPPDFRFDEINQIAEFIQKTAEDLKDALEREHQFLRNASHELRTPIAVIQSNIDLLNRLNIQGDDRVNASYGRIKRAVHNMQQLTETLLWLSRKEEKMPAAETVELSVMVGELIEENRYLLAGKNVEIEQDLERVEVFVPRAAIRIVLGNLIRNAFQHSMKGEISITLDTARIQIINHYEAHHELPPESGEYGFELGLTLIELICQKTKLSYTKSKTQNTYVSAIALHPKS